MVLDVVIFTLWVLPWLLVVVHLNIALPTFFVLQWVFFFMIRVKSKILSGFYSFFNFIFFLFSLREKTLKNIILGGFNYELCLKIFSLFIVFS